MSIALYELSTAYLNVVSLIDDEESSDDILNALTTIEGAIEVKASNIANLIKSLESEVEVIRSEEKRLAQRRKSKENAADNVKQYLKGAMEQMGMDNIKTPTRTISIQNNPPALYIYDQDILNGKYLILVPEHYEVNKKVLTDELKSGKHIKGAELRVGRSLRIR